MMDCNRIHSCWPSIEQGSMEEDMLRDNGDDIEEVNDESELGYCNRSDESNEFVKVFIQKCVICFERDSDYVLKQFGHESLCEQCYQNNGNIDILRCYFCKTFINFYNFYVIYELNQARKCIINNTR